MDKRHEHEEAVRERIRNSEMVAFFTGSFFTIVTGVKIYKGNNWYLLIWLIPVVYGIYKLYRQGRIGDYINPDFIALIYYIAGMTFMLIYTIKSRAWLMLIYLCWPAGTLFYVLVKGFIDEVRGK